MQSVNTLQDLSRGGVNPYLEGMGEAGLGQIGRNYNRNIMPGIDTESIMSGQAGGSRHGVAQGIAASDANQQSTDFIQNLYGGAYDADQNRRLQAAGGLEQMQQGAQATRLGAEGQYNQNMFNQASFNEQNNLNAANYADQNAMNQGNLASAIATNQSNAWNASANAIRPVTLTNSSSHASSSSFDETNSWSYGKGDSFNFGIL